MSLSLRSSLSVLAVALGLTALYASGCGGNDDHVVCDAQGQNCQICDAYGCRPATGNTGGSGGGTVSSSDTGGTGGGPACDPSTTTCPCDAGGKCADGKSCVDGLCIDGCDFTYQCGAGKVCDNGACVPSCDTTHPCNAGLTCQNGACVPDPNNPACGPNNPCPSGQICGANGQCTTTCTANSQCGAGAICDGSTGQCVPDPSPQPICNAQKACPEPQVCQTDGFCHYPCSTDAKCKLYDNRFVKCDQGICKTDEEVNPQCTLANPCPAGKTCVSNKCL